MNAVLVFPSRGARSDLRQTGTESDPCDHCGVTVRYEDPGGSPFLLLCEKCEAEMQGFPHPHPCVKCEGAS